MNSRRNPLFQMPRRDIDGHPRWRDAFSLPYPQRLADIARHPLIQAADQIRLFRQLQEITWRQQTALRMIPANQRFDAADTAILQANLRLIEQDKLILVDGLAQLTLQLQALIRAFPHLGHEERVTFVT
jgi:hypothetical protein